MVKSRKDELSMADDDAASLMSDGYDADLYGDADDRKR